jgi:hypothetical protein
MKLFKATLLVLIVLPILLHSANKKVVSRESKAALYKTAESELLEILEKMQVGEEAEYGFNDRNEFYRAQLGIPYQEYSLPYKNFSEQTYKPTGYWRIPVVVDGENRAMLRYIIEDGEWKWKGFGATGLARELGALEKSRSEKPLSGRILRDYNFVCDYIQFDIVAEDTIEGYLIPLKNAKAFLETVDSTVKKQYNVSEIMELRLDREPDEIPHTE